jgi:hypothetical protein
MDKIKTEFYKKYVGDYAKRFYTSFKEGNILKIIGFKMERGQAFIEIYEGGEKWFWDMDDSVIITDEPFTEEIERIANVKHPEYKGWNPFIKK